MDHFVVGLGDFGPNANDLQTVWGDYEDAKKECLESANSVPGTRFRIYELIERGSAIATPAQYYESTLLAAPEP